MTTAMMGMLITMGVYLFGMIKDRDAYDRNGDGFTDITRMQSETIGFRGYYKTSMQSKLTAEYHHIKEHRRGGDNIDEPPHMAEIAEQVEAQVREKLIAGAANKAAAKPAERPIAISADDFDDED